MPQVTEQPFNTQESSAVQMNPDMQATTSLLRESLSPCAACGESLDTHTCRFFSCHPDVDTEAGRTFKAAARSGNWKIVHAMQTPSLGQPRLVVYAVACPGQSSGMVAMFRFGTEDAGSSNAQLHQQQSLAAGAFAALRALCPTCQWIAFTPALQSAQENV